MPQAYQVSHCRKEQKLKKGKVAKKVAELYGTGERSPAQKILDLRLGKFVTIVPCWIIQ